MNNRRMAALHIAADAIREKDGGDTTTESGWKSDELLDAWLVIHSEIENAIQDHVDNLSR
jgi:hypothetical protein